MPSPLPLPPFLHAFAEDVLALSSQLGAAQDVQWVSSPRLQVDSDGRRATGTYSDPVPATVTDRARLRVRAAVVGAETTLRGARAAVGDASAALELALAEWSAGVRRVQEQPT